MLKNYIKIALRNLVKNRSHSIINIGGLAIGIVCVLIIFLIIQFEYSFNTHVEDVERIYRIVRLDTDFGEMDYDSGVPYPMPDAVRNDFPEIDVVALTDQNYEAPVLSVEDENGEIQRFREPQKTVFVQPQYFKIFNYEWLAGHPETVLERPNTVAISESMARKLFGTLDVAGKNITLQTSNKYDLEVTGIFKDPPVNFDFPFELIASFHSRDQSGEQRGNDNWDGTSTSTQCYIKLKEGIHPAGIESRMDAFIIKYRDEEAAKTRDYLLQPLNDLHFDTRFETYLERTVSRKSLLALGLIGLFLLIAACINYVNLNTALAVARSKEIGIRKALGGSRRQLIVHFLGETFIIILLSIILAVALAEIVLPNLEPVLGFALNVNLWDNPPVLLFLGGLTMVITLAAGLYPALHLSGMETIEAIRNKITAQYGEGLVLRRTLVIVQFGITQMLIIGTIVISLQMDYFQSAEMGFNEQAVVEVPLPFRDSSELDLMKQQLSGISSIQNFSFSNTGTAHNNVWGGNYALEDSSEIKTGNAQVKYTDPMFVETYGINLLAGQNLVESDTVRQYLVNETFARETGYTGRYEDLLGKYVDFWGRKAPIVGVVKDFNTQSFHEEIKPVLLASRHIYMQAGIKINMQQSGQALANIERAFETVFPDYVFEYTFLDDRIAEFYEQERQTARLVNIFTAIAVLIGCLGLFGLVSYMAFTRRKEVSVRKVLGATVRDIMLLFSKEFFLLIGISFLIAAPAAWLIMNRWLSDFEYRVELGPGLFMIAFFATAMIALMTVGYKSLRTAMANPAENLKSE